MLDEVFDAFLFDTACTQLLASGWETGYALIDVVTGRERWRVSSDSARRDSYREYHDARPERLLAFTADGRVVAAVTAPGCVEYRSSATGELVATLQIMGDEWLAMTPDGRYDCSPGAAAMAHWVEGSTTSGLHERANTVHVHDLLAGHLGIAEPTPPRTWLDGEDLDTLIVPPRWVVGSLGADEVERVVIQTPRSAMLRTIRAGSILAGTHLDRSVPIYDAGSGRLLRQLATGHAHVRGDDRYVVIAAESAVTVVDGERRRLLPAIEHDLGRPCALAVAGGIAAILRVDGTIAFWRIDAPETLHRIRPRLGQARSIRLSWDGAVLAASTHDNILWFWETATGGFLSEVDTRQRKYLTYVLGPDGRYCIVSGLDCARIIDTATGETVAGTTYRHGYELTLGATCSIAVSSVFLALPREDDPYALAIAVWDLAGGLVRTLDLRPRSGMPLGLCVDRHMIAFTDDDDVVRIVDMTSGEDVAVIDMSPVRQHWERIGKHESGIAHSIGHPTFAPDGGTISAATEKLRFSWSVDDGSFVGQCSASRERPGRHDDVSWKRAVVTVGTSGVCALGVSDDTIWLYASEPVPTEQVGEIQAIAAADDGSATALGYRTGHVSITAHAYGVERSIRFPESADPWPGMRVSSGVVAVALATDGGLAAGLSDGTLWYVAPDDDHPVLLGALDSPVVSLAFDSGGERLAVGGGWKMDNGDRYHVAIWSITERSEVLFDGMRLSDRAASLDGAHPHSYVVACVAFHPRGAMLATGGRISYPREGEGSDAVLLWDLARGAVTERIGGYTDRSRFAFAPDGSSLVIPLHDGAICIHDLTDGGRSARFPLADEPFLAVALAPGGARLVTASRGSEIAIWDRSTSQRLATIHPTAKGSWVAVSPDGTFDAPETSLDEIGWTTGLEEVARGDERPELRRPGLVEDSLGTRSDALARLGVMVAEREAAATP